MRPKDKKPVVPPAPPEVPATPPDPLKEASGLTVQWNGAGLDDQRRLYARIEKLRERGLQTRVRV